MTIILINPGFLFIACLTCLFIWLIPLLNDKVYDRPMAKKLIKICGAVVAFIYLLGIYANVYKLYGIAW